MANQDTIISRYINDVATLRHQLIVAETDLAEARQDAAEKDGTISALKSAIEQLQQPVEEVSSAVVEGEVVEEEKPKRR